MRIAILVRILWPAGAQRIAISEAKTLIEMGHEVRLIFIRRSGRKDYYDLLEGLQYEVMPKSRSKFTSWVFSMITSFFMPDRKGEGRVDYDLIKKFPQYFSKSNCDLLICHDQWAGLAGYYLKKQNNTDYKVIVHEKPFSYRSTPLGKLADFLERKVMKNARMVLAVSEVIRQSVIRNFNVQCDLLLPGATKHSFAGFDKRENIVLTVSFWDQGRYPEIYIKLIEKLQGFKLIIAGNWRDLELEDEFISKIQASSAKDRIAMEDSLSEADLIGLYQKSKFLVRFGFNEYGPGMANIEAVSNGLPIITNRSMGVSDLVGATHAGFVIDGTIVPEIHENATDWYSKRLIGSAEQNELLDLDLVAQLIQVSNNAPSYSELQTGCMKMINKLSWTNHCLELIKES